MSSLRRPSPALVVACIALVVALGGTATAASVAIRSSAQIAPGVIQKSDLSTRALRSLTKTGPAGPAGAAGVAGERGADGATGAAGPRGEAGPQGENGPAGATGPQGAAGDDGKDAFTDVGADFSQNPRVMGGATYMDIPSAAAGVTVPAGRQATVVAHFSAEAVMFGSPGDRCSVRIVLDGQPMTPSDGVDDTFDSVSDGAGFDNAEQHAIVRYAQHVGPGDHTVAAQAATTKTGATDPQCRIDDLAMVAQAIEEE